MARASRNWKAGTSRGSRVLRSNDSTSSQNFQWHLASRTESLNHTTHIPATLDTYESMAKSRYASPGGVAIALGKIDELDEAMRNDTTWSSKASCSSGAELELEDCHILMVASDSNCDEQKLRAASTYRKDALDARAIMQILVQVRTENGQVVQAFTCPSIC
ncbi:hypothetical protein BJ875DRAFT_486550 [Amylocarpus encephaloides]|uniref:Uncharacterized protein n=1 Tax=Amylocarpus encephaloides TaxID=45428 RepID=A0A9P8C3E2_9HELO|nr:hypothetical protein BJ875DRAFT_486550 [Amylocarpus encephaloides]